MRLGVVMARDYSRPITAAKENIRLNPMEQIAAPGAPGKRPHGECAGLSVMGHTQIKHNLTATVKNRIPFGYFRPQAKKTMHRLPASASRRPLQHAFGAGYRWPKIDENSPSNHLRPGPHPLRCPQKSCPHTCPRNASHGDPRREFREHGWNADKTRLIAVIGLSPNGPFRSGRPHAFPFLGHWPLPDPQEGLT